VGDHPGLALEVGGEVILEFVHVSHLVRREVDEHVLRLDVLDGLGQLEIHGDRFLFLVDRPVDHDDDFRHLHRSVPLIGDVAVSCNPR
jgi:hypothetical protein